MHLGMSEGVTGLTPCGEGHQCTGKTSWLVHRRAADEKPCSTLSATHPSKPVGYILAALCRNVSTHYCLAGRSIFRDIRLSVCQTPLTPGGFRNCIAMNRQLSYDLYFLDDEYWTLSTDMPLNTNKVVITTSNIFTALACLIFQFCKDGNGKHCPENYYEGLYVHNPCACLEFPKCGASCRTETFIFFSYLDPN